MKTYQTYLAYFSATHTSYRVGNAIARGLCGEEAPQVQELNATFQSLPLCTLTQEDLLIVSVPVYGGHVAPIALERLSQLQGNQTPAVAVVVYGNRDFETAAVELQQFLTNRQFKVIAAAAFIGEHSYSTAAHPIACGRPDSNDLQEATDLGRQIRQKLQTGAVSPVIDASQLRCPESGEENLLGFRTFIQQCQQQAQTQKPKKLVPTVQTERCTSCGACAQVCPTGAIDPEHPDTLDAARCIKCCACVKACPEQARSLATPFGPVLSRFFQDNKKNVYIL